MFVVDTNVLVYAADADAPEHEPCRTALEDWRRGHAPWYLTWGIVYEFLRVVTHPRVLRQPFATVGAMSFVEAVLASPSVHVMTETSRHLEVLAEIVDEVSGRVSRAPAPSATQVLPQIVWLEAKDWPVSGSEIVEPA